MTSSNIRSVGRPPMGDQTLARFPKGTLGRIKSVLRDGESQADFMREAVELELRRREGPPVGGPDRA
ncbi:YlcI/YnfO family protein [Sphingobium aquiterrae]|uniref:YlcI/YnfO family protein n=2 Tax=Alphaproteobacteria TaxID=28211 RepID=UPI0022EDED66|nr:hypothetical protein Sbs19_41540 [Sphingobium sp. BS19]